MGLTHGVMVTLRFLVPSFKVRVLVGQQQKNILRWFTETYKIYKFPVIISVIVFYQPVFKKGIKSACIIQADFFVPLHVFKDT